MIADMMAEAAPPLRRSEFTRLYFLRAGMEHAPITRALPSWAMPKMAEWPSERCYLSINDIDVRINPAGADWGKQQGRTVSYIVNWFERRERKFPNDADRVWYIWGFDS